MERLTGLDAGFLYMETPTLHMHTLKVAIVDFSKSPLGHSFDLLREHLGKRLHLLPAFRRRIVEVPAGFHHPIWIEDPTFDIDRHLHAQTLPAPGSQRQLDEAIAEIAGEPLDRSKPLWEMWNIEGLEGGRVAFVLKLHHAAADGVAAASMLANVMTLEPGPPDPPAPETRWEPEPVPTAWELLRAAFFSHLKLLSALPRLLARTIRGLRELVRTRRASTLSPPVPFDAPKTSFNSSLTPHRTFATTTLDLKDFKTVKNAFGVTINDVVLGVTAGAARDYLEARGELPGKSLVAGVPVSTADPKEIRRLSGNRVSNMFTSLRTDIADPIERLRAIHAVTKEAKVLHNVLGADMLQAWTEYTPPWPYSAAVRLWSRWKISSRIPPVFNVIVSNVPGPATPLYVAGAELQNIYSVGPILEGIGLNLTAWSYRGRMNFGVIACREQIPNLHEITDGLRRHLGELVGAAQAAGEAREFKAP